MVCTKRALRSIANLRIGERGLVLFELRLRDRQICSVLVDDGLIRARVDLGADLSLLHLRIVVAIKLLDDAGNVCPDDDRELGVDRPSCSHAASNGALGHGHSRIMDRARDTQGQPCDGPRHEQQR